MLDPISLSVGAIGLGLTTLFAPFAVHRVPEGHVAVYYRGGALLDRISGPGFHMLTPVRARAFMRTRTCAPQRNRSSTTAPRRCLSTSTTCRRPCRLTRHAPRCTHCAQPAPPQQPCPASQVTDIPCGTSGGTVIQFDRIEVVNQLKREMVHATVSPRPSDSPRHDQASPLRARSRAVRIRAGEELHDRVRQDVDLR